MALRPRSAPRVVLGGLLRALLVGVLVSLTLFLPSALAQALAGGDYVAAGIAFLGLAVAIELIVWTAKSLPASLCALTRRM